MAIDIYGEIVVSTGKIPTVTVDRISGGRIERDASGKPARLHLHYFAGGQPQVMVVGFLDGMFLLSVLKSIQLDTKTPFPDDPRGKSPQQH
jgi:hypothetical protein